ncbi:MAG: ATP-binding protein [Actinomycetia bacterium]|nr:ATP-binding protein [Actinomycetes bacterium]MCH9801848.1 ATP-binding protein [Actinomycetes bacterium]
MLGALVLGVVIGGGVRWLMGGRTHLNLSSAIVAGILGSGLGAGTLSVLIGLTDAGAQALLDSSQPLLDRELPPEWLLVTLIAGIAASLAYTFLVLTVMTKLSEPPKLSAAELVLMGESANVEFKSSARYNLHTNQRDPKIELVVSKTVAALANSEGGILLIGVGDDGLIAGLANDYKFMKKPDNDRYELWLRDHLAVTLGADAAAAVRVEFPQVSNTEICRLDIPRADRPIFVSPGKGKDPELWVRIGNSTRELPIDEAFAYGSRQWGRRQLRRVG